MRDIANELDRAFDAARRIALTSGVDLGDTIDPLYAMHKALKASHASGGLTDQQYTEKSRELLELLGNTVVSLFTLRNMSRKRPQAATASVNVATNVIPFRRTCK